MKSVISFASSRENFSKQLFTSLLGHPETMKSAFAPYVGAASSRELFETVAHVPFGHPETMKNAFAPYVGAASSRELFVTVPHAPSGHPETMKSVIPFASLLDLSMIRLRVGTFRDSFSRPFWDTRKP
jgi:hypothetical protein